MRIPLILLVLFVLFGHSMTGTLGSMCTQKAFSFGWNQYGQLGDTTNIDQNTPVAVDPSRVLKGLNITSVSGGDYHSLVLADNGKVFSFGRNNYGQLGDNTQTEKNIPVAINSSGVLNGHTITAISAGSYHSLVLSATGQVFSFGCNDYGRLGDGTQWDRYSPVAVVASGALNGKTITAIAAGDYHSLVLSDTGQVFSFGYNGNGQLGDGTTSTKYSPVAVDTSGALNGLTITAIAAGWYHSLVLSSTGQAFSFGSNDYGQLGVGTTISKSFPVQVLSSGVLNGQLIVAIDCVAHHSLVLSATGKVFSFGRNQYGQLGDGTTTTRLSPVAVNTSGVLNGVQITAIAAGGYHSLALSATGKLFSWGWNDYGQLGDGTWTDSNFPISVSIPNEILAVGISRIDAGESHSMFFTSSLKNMTTGEIRDGATPGQQILFQSTTNKVAANWDAFMATPANGQSFIVKKYSITTIENGTGQAVMGPRLIEFENDSEKIFSTEQSVDVSLIHNHFYFTQIYSPNCDDLDSISSNGFLVDTTPPEIGFVDVLTSRWSKNGDLMIEWSEIEDPESGIISTNISFVDVDNENGTKLLESCDVKIEESSGEFNLTWESCGVKLPTGKSLKIEITALNGAGLLTTKLSETSFRIGDLLITKLINWETNSNSTFKACRLATIEWESLGLSGTTVMLSLVDPISSEIVLNITEQPVSVELNQFRWEPVPEDIPLGTFRISLKSMSQLDRDLISLSWNISIEAADACIEVTSPNKASSWKTGEQHSITWTISGSKSISGNVSFELLKDGQLETDLDTVNISTGSYSWLISSQLYSDTKYQIRATAKSAQGLMFSTPFFEIVGLSPDSSQSSANLLDNPFFVWGIVGGVAIGITLILILVLIILTVIVAIICHRRKHKPKVDQNLQMTLPSLENRSTFESTTSKSSNTFNSSTSRITSTTGPLISITGSMAGSIPASTGGSRAGSVVGSMTTSTGGSRASTSLSFRLIPVQDLLLEHELGKGAYGIVYKGKYQGRDVAIKTLNMVRGDIEDFNKEVEIMGKLQHPRLVELIGVVNGQEVGIVMEFVEKGSLDNFLWRRKDNNNNKLSWNQKLAILHDIATGMAFVHSKGFIHRDLKSLNVLIGRDNRAKVADLGLARSMEKTASTITAQIGSRYWMAPEVASGSGHYDEKCDVFSFGIIMNEVLSDKEPYFQILNKESIMLNVVRFADFRPLVPTVELVKQNLSTEQERALVDKRYSSYLSLMQLCWHNDPRVRPAFVQVIQRMNEIATLF